MGRTKVDQTLNGQTGLYPETLPVGDALQYVEKQIADLTFAQNRLLEIHNKLLALSNTGSQMDGFILEPTGYLRVCTSIKLTLKL